MEELIEVSTHDDEEYGLVVECIDSEGNRHFYGLEINDKGERIYNKFDDEVDDILFERYN